jgi:hypothetical protein
MAKNKLLGTRTSPEVIASKPRMSKDMMDQERRYKAQDAMSTLARADEIRGDRALMKDVQMLAKRTMKAVCGPGKK